MAVQDIVSESGNAWGRVWVGEVPDGTDLGAADIVETYWNNPGPSALSSTTHVALEVVVHTDPRMLYGLLGAEFRPHEYNFVRVSVPTVTASDPYSASIDPLIKARVGLPGYACGGVLAGSTFDPSLLGCGTLAYRWAAVSDLGSSWEVFRLLAIGVVRILVIRPGGDPASLIPYFEGSHPPPPGGKRR